MPPGAYGPSGGASSSGGASAGGGAASEGGTTPPTDAASRDDRLATERARASRAANRAAKRAASGRPPSGTPRRAAKRPSSTGPLIAVGAVAAAVVLGVIAFGNPFGGGASPSGSPRGSASADGYGDGTCPTSPPEPLAPGEKRTVTIETDLGTIIVDVDANRAPIATANFVALVECAYYDGIGFHRLVPGFVIQGGDPDGTGSGPGPGYSIEDDPLVGNYRRGTVAMARTSQPDSQGSQFFIVLSDDADASLKSSQYPYAILGEVTSGMDVVDAIAAMPNSGSDSGNAALDPVIMTSVTVTSGATASPSAAAGTSPTPASTIDGGPVFPSPSTAPAQ